ncbi:MAG TPA: hypothetical protein V6D19_09815 [Stenomitos sp.]
MSAPISFIFKLLMLSTLVSVAIKTLGPRLPIPATSPVALILVLLPTLIMAIALGVQYQMQHR